MTFCRSDMARRAGSSRKRGVSVVAEDRDHRPAVGPAVGPAEHAGPGRVHERDLPGLVDGAHALAEAAGDQDEVVLLPLDFGVEVGVGQGDRRHRRQRIEQSPIGVVEGLGPAAARDGQPEPAVGQLDRRRQRALPFEGGSSVSDTSGERSSDPAELSTAARVSVAADGAVDVERGLEQAAQARAIVGCALLSVLSVVIAPCPASVPDRRGCRCRSRQGRLDGGRDRSRVHPRGVSRARDEPASVSPGRQHTAMVPPTRRDIFGSVLPGHDESAMQTRMSATLRPNFGVGRCTLDPGIGIGGCRQVATRADAPRPMPDPGGSRRAAASPSRVTLRLGSAPCRVACGTPAAGARRPPRPRRPRAPPGCSRRS